MSPKRVSDLAPSNLTRVICTEEYSRWLGAKVGTWSWSSWEQVVMIHRAYTHCY